MPFIRDLSDPRAKDVIARHRVYWENGSWHRPLFGVSGPLLLKSGGGERVLEPERLDPRQFREQVEQSYDQHGLLNDDLIRMVGPGVFIEAIFGCRAIERAGTVWLEPCFRDWHQLDDFDLSKNVWFQTLLDNTKIATDAVDTSRYPFRDLHLRGAVDLITAMMTTERMCEAAVDEPDKLREFIARATDIWVQVARAHHELLPGYDGGTFNSYGTWAPGPTVTYNLDAAMFLAPEQYQDLFVQFELAVSEAFECPFTHLHGSAAQHFDTWADVPKLRIQCVVDVAWFDAETNMPVGRTLTDLLPGFQRIQRKKSLMIYGNLEPPDLDLAMRSLKPGGLALCASVRDPAAVREQYVTGDAWLGGNGARGGS